MEIIGERLKSSREEHGLSLEEVSEDLKISVEELNNIEEGKRGAFSDIFLLKKYIHDYAKYLGLDYDKFIEDFNEYVFEYTSKIPVDVIERISKQKEKEENNKPTLSPYTVERNNVNKTKIIILSLIVLVVIGGLIAFFTIRNKDNETHDLVMSSLL